MALSASTQKNKAIVTGQILSTSNSSGTAEAVNAIRLPFRRLHPDCNTIITNKLHIDASSSSKITTCGTNDAYADDEKEQFQLDPVVRVLAGDIRGRGSIPCFTTDFRYTQIY
ncbi:unnamed protein product [Caretta caretta]